MFISVTEASDKLIQNLSTFEFFRPELVTNGSLVFVDLPVMYQSLGLEHEELRPRTSTSSSVRSATWSAELGVSRLVLDSLTSVWYRIRRDEQIRDFILRLGLELSDAGCTSLLVSEIGPTQGRYSPMGWRRRSSMGSCCSGTHAARRHPSRPADRQDAGDCAFAAQYVIELTPIGLLLAPHLKGADGVDGGG